MTIHNFIIAHQDSAFDKNMIAYNNNILNLNHKNCYFSGSSTISNGTNNLFANTAGDLLLNADYSVNECSPVINMGDNNLTFQFTDINGNPRIFDTGIDIGAYEAQAICSSSPREFNNVEKSISKEINIYPNPDRNQLNIETKLEDISVIISDILGRNIIQSNFQKTIDIRSLDKGIYLLYIYKDKKIITVKRFIKK